MNKVVIDESVYSTINNTLGQSHNISLGLMTKLVSE